MHRPLKGLITTLYEIDGGPKPLCYFIKGMVNPQMFLDEIRKEYNDQTPYTTDDVKHNLIRLVPAKSHPGQMYIVYAHEPGHGVFRSTQLDIPQ